MDSSSSKVGGVRSHISTEAGHPNRLLNIGFVGGAPVNQPPVAAFTFSCTGLTCSFNGTSSSDDVGVTSYSWNFGDNTSGSGATVSKTYASAGTYSVTLTVTDAGNLSNATTRSVSVAAAANQAPVAVPVVHCNGTTTCTFDGTRSTDDQGVVGYEWRTARNKVISTEPTWTLHFERLGGRLTWSLTVRDAAGLSNKKSFTFTVGQP